MKLVRFPYRWLPRTFWTNITRPYWDIKNGIRNLFTFFDAVWWFRSWDESGLLRLIQTSAHEMRKCQEHGSHVGADRYVRQLLVVETMCKRLRADDYFENAGYLRDGWDTRPDHEKSWIARHSEYMAKQDAVHLGKMFKFVRHWWD